MRVPVLALVSAGLGSVHGGERDHGSLTGMCWTPWSSPLSLLRFSNPMPSFSGKCLCTSEDQQQILCLPLPLAPSGSCHYSSYIQVCWPYSETAIHLWWLIHWVRWCSKMLILIKSSFTTPCTLNSIEILMTSLTVKFFYLMDRSQRSIEWCFFLDVVPS